MHRFAMRKDVKIEGQSVPETGITAWISQPGPLMARLNIGGALILFWASTQTVFGSS